jgi:beta-lactamase regulating signal transducer with metallopeptidase domain
VSKAAGTSNAEQAAINTRARKARVEATPLSSQIGRAYDEFLGLPVAVVLLVLWVAGVAMLGTVVLVAYAVISTLVWGW